MQTRFLAISALALSLVTGAAFAAEAISGKVSDFNPETRELVLDTGETFVLDAAIDAEQIEISDEVTLTYDKVDDKNVATAIEIVQ